MSEKKKCSGARCPMNAATMKVDECQCVDTCPDYTPVLDYSGMDAIVSAAAEAFGIETPSDKQKLRDLFNAYLAQFIALCAMSGGASR